GAGLMTGVIPIPDFDAAPTHIVSPATSSIEAEPQPLAQMSSNLLRPVQTSELERAIVEMGLPEAEKERPNNLVLRLRQEGLKRAFCCAQSIGCRGSNRRAACGILPARSRNRSPTD